MKKIKILLLGDSCTDVWVYGDCKRLSPEAPVPIFVPHSEKRNGGMSENVLNNIYSLYKDAEVTFYESKEEIIKKRFVDRQSSQHILRIDAEKAGAPLSYEEIRDDNYDGVIISDYNKGFISHELVSKIADESIKKGIPVFLDTKKKLGEWSKNVTFVKINETEYRLNDKLENFCQNLIVTLGPNGSLWFNKSYIEPSEVVKVSDVVGAGDTYLAAFSISYILNKDVKKAMKDANTASRIAVSQHGVVAVDGKGIFYE